MPAVQLVGKVQGSNGCYMSAYIFNSKQGSVQECLSGGLNCCAMCCIRVYSKQISEICKNCIGRFLEGSGPILKGTGLLNHCRPVWAEPCKGHSNL